MISPEIYGKDILNAFLNTKNLDSIYVDDPLYSGKIDPNKRNRVVFGQDVYIGLLTKMPTSTDNSWAEPTAPEYQRFKLSRKSTTTNDPILSSHISEEAIEITTTITTADGSSTEDVIDRVRAAYVVNDDNIIFPEVSSDLTHWGGSSGGETGLVVGFGLFSTKEGGKPFFWGEVKPDEGSGDEVGVEIRQNEVPIIRIGGFKVTVT